VLEATIGGAAMLVKNLVSSLIGLWFILIPFLLGFALTSAQAAICFILGAVQFIFSILSVARKGRPRWIHGIPILIGVWFIIFPNVYDLHLFEFVLLELLGLATILLNYALIFPESQ
jgi:hypothetical protein